MSQSWASSAEGKTFTVWRLEPGELAAPASSRRLSASKDVATDSGAQGWRIEDVQRLGGISISNRVSLALRSEHGRAYKGLQSRSPAFDPYLSL